MKKPNKFFRGTIDQLLSHVAEGGNSSDENLMNSEASDENTILTDDEAIAEIQTCCGVNKKDAKRILREIKLTETTKAIKSMIKKGLLRVAKYDASGEPLYEMTEKGKKHLT